MVSHEQLTPGMVRVVLGGDDLDGFVSLGHDDHIKLFLADAGRAVDPDGPASPAAAGPGPMRDFTPRQFNAATRLLTVDFALHQAGPATAWASQVAPGQTLEVGGPRGSMVVADDFDWYLLAGDETALPAIARRLEELRPDTSAIVVVTVVDAAEQIALPSAANVATHWVHRPAAAAADPGPLLAALAQIDLPPGDGYAWIAAESGVAKAARTHLVERGHNPAWLKAAAYWRAGTAAVHETIE